MLSARSTIEVAHSRYFFRERRGSLTRNRPNANLVSKKGVLVYAWAVELLIGGRKTVFAEVSFWVAYCLYGAPQVGGDSENQG